LELYSKKNCSIFEHAYPQTDSAQVADDFPANLQQLINIFDSVFYELQLSKKYNQKIVDYPKSVIFKKIIL
jgi:hypothetical protein